MICKLKNLGIQRVIDVDGKTLVPVAYMSYAPLRENFDAMREQGIRLFMFPVYAGDEGINMESGLRPFCDNFFKGYGEYDFSAVDEALSRIFPSGNEDGYVIPRVCLEPPIWWQRLHPSEVSRDFRGEEQRESFASELWKADMTVALYALIDHINASVYADRVIGYHVAAGGTEEWTYQCRYAPQYYDYSEVNLRAYRRYLSKRYHGVSELSRSHGISYSSWDDVVFPHPCERRYCESGYLRDPKTERAVLDYYDYHNESVADAILYFCRKVKEYTGGERLVGVFYGYVFSMPQNYKGLHALGKVLASPDVDFLSTTNSGVDWHFASAVNSAILHGKMWISEGDIRTCKSSGMGKNLAHAMPDNDFYDSPVWRGPSDVEGSVYSLTRAAARIATTPTGIWWFDMFGGWFDDPDMLSVIKRSIHVLSEQKCDLFPTEVALVVDERGHKYSSLDDKKMPSAIRELLDNIATAGFPYDNYLLSDIANPDFDPSPYRLVIFIAAFDPTDEELDAIERKLKRDGRVLLFLGGSGAYSKSLTGYSLRVSRDDRAKRAEFEGEVYPSFPIPSPTVEREEGYVLSRFEDDGAAVLWKREAGYHSILALPLALPSALLRHIALLSGVHLYNRAGDVVFAGGEYVGILATEEGYRRICLPIADAVARDFLGGESVSVNDRFIDMYMKKGEMRLLHIEKTKHEILGNKNENDRN
ncbi:MAG: beta-galactosidase [Clostridia bacterium]|nr:beta-galactosidase [Clostridia bacterium]